MSPTFESDEVGFRRPQVKAHPGKLKTKRCSEEAYAWDAVNDQSPDEIVMVGCKANGKAAYERVRN